MDDDARWCNTCTELVHEDPAGWDDVCRQCREGDENKDIVVQDAGFVRLWRAVQYKAAGIPVLDLIADLDDALAIKAIEDQVQVNQAEDLEEQRDRRQQARAAQRPNGLIQVEE